MILTGIVSIIFVYMSYYFIMSLHTYFGTFKRVPDKVPKVSFLVLIPAVNEENVISTPVTCLVNQEYPNELYDTYVVADHCTDNTAKVALKAGAKIITTGTNPNFVRYGIGKSNTLDYGLHCVPNWSNYDYLVVVDSDNEVSSNFLQRINDTIQYYQEPEAVQVKLLSKVGKGFINTGLNLSFERANLFQQLPENSYGCSSLYGTGFATNISKVLVPINGFRFKTLTEDAYEELAIISKGGDIRFVSDATVSNENYSSFKQASRGITRWSRGTFSCFIYFFVPTLLKLIISPTVKRFHVLCRTSTLSKSLQILLMWGYWVYNYIWGPLIPTEYTLLYPVWIQHIMLILSLVMTINIVLVESIYILYPKYGMIGSIRIIGQAYIFQLLYSVFNLVAVVTFWKKKWVVSRHGDSK